MMVRFVKDLVGLAQGAAKTSQGGRSRNRDLHPLLHVRFQIARLVREFNGQIAKSLVVGTQHHFVRRYSQHGFLACGGQAVTGDHIAPLIQCFRSQCSGLIGQFEKCFVLLDRLVCYLFAIQEQANGCGIRINFYNSFFSLIALPAPAVEGICKLPCAGGWRFLCVIQRTYSNERFFSQAPDDLHEIHRRQGLSGNIDHSLSGKQGQPVVGMVSPVANTGFPQVIPGRPDKIPQKLGIFLHPFPVVGQIGYHGFRANHQSVRIFLDILIIPGRSIV